MLDGLRFWKRRKLGIEEANAAGNSLVTHNALILPVARHQLCIGPDGNIRSVVFLHNSYYHFLFLASALRKRGWDALSVSLEHHNSPNAFFYHGEDVNLYAADHAVFSDQLNRAVTETADRFRMVHFAGDGQMSFYPWGFDGDPRRTTVPKDFIRLREQGVKIAYSSGGCADGIAQSSFRQWSGGMCNKCTLQAKPEFCSDLRNLAWCHKREMFCDINFAETLPALDYQSGTRTFREPATMCLDAYLWRPDIDIPDRFRLERAPGEILVYHGVGNYFAPHYAGNRDVKGTGAIIAAIDRLKLEGMPVRLVFVHDVPSRDVRYIQVQADIVVDQLNMGRYGANARESMMLGRPVIGRIDPAEPSGVKPLVSLQECPIVDATEDTVYHVLKRLCGDADERHRLSDLSRAYAMKWHSADACAERYEKIYDAVMAGANPNTVAVI
jgi:hypothetical protein